MIKVAYINTVAGFNATGRICELLASGEQIDPIIFYGRKSYDGPVPSYKFNNLLGNSVHALSTFLIDNHGFVNKKQTKELIKNLKEFNPDIIHLHNLHGYYLDIETLFEGLKELNKPVVYTLHDCWSFTGHCPHFENANCLQWKSQCKNCSLYLTYPPTFNKFNVNRNYKRKSHVFNSHQNIVYVSPSIWLKDLFKQSFLKNNRIEVIPNGIDLNIFKPALHDRKDVIELIAVASVWTKGKGLNDLVQLSKLLNQNFHLTVVGLNEKQAKLFDDNVSTISRTNNQSELVKLYQNADYFINFTYQDTFPTVNLESLACGTPVITYRSGGSSEMVHEGCGFVIDRGNYKQCYELLNSPRVNEISREKCSKYALNFSKQNMCHKYYQLYDDLLKKS